MKAIMRDKAELKDSGIEWIGLYPVSWDMYPANGVFSEIRNKNTSLEYTNQFSFRYGEIVDKHVQGELDDKLKDTISAYNIVQPDTIMINGLNLNYDFISQRVAIVREPGIITSAYLALYPNKERINPRFAVYLFKAYDYQQVFHGMGSGIRKTLSFQNFKNIFIVAPQLGQQEAIANYLDDNCSKIDTIIAEAKASIEEYKELKQAVIYEAVTKGLDKNVEMKDSGIEWIGKIPAHWTVKKIKRLGTARNGLTYSPNDMTDEIKGTLVIRSSNIQNGKWDYRDNVYVSCEIPDELMLKTGDIVICSRNGSRNLIGKNAMVDSNNIQTFGAFMMVYRSHIDNKEYIFWLLNSGMFKYYLPMFFTATINQLTRNNFNEMTVPFTPSKDEQDQIVQYIEKKVSIFDSLIAEKQSLIEDLEDYKKSLIYEVVTGKRKVVE